MGSGVSETHARFAFRVFRNVDVINQTVRRYVTEDRDFLFMRVNPNTNVRQRHIKWRMDLKQIVLQKHVDWNSIKMARRTACSGKKRQA